MTTLRPSQLRVAWIVASRGDVLTLGPLFQDFTRRHTHGVAHWLFDTGEVGMAAVQARDFIGLIPEESGDLCHPADEPAVRLSLMLGRVESFIRRRKGTHVIFSGFGPSAAATAIYCHARGCRALWLRPPDPAGLVGRLRWESGLERMIHACAPCVELFQIPAAPAFSVPAAAAPLELELPGLRPGAPLMLIAVLRRDWGYLDDATTRLARAAARWAAARPDADFLVVSNLNARLEGPMRSLPERPANLLLAPPLPYPVYEAALGRARLVLTDSPLIAAQALERAIPTATLGDQSAPASSAAPLHHPLLPAEMEGPDWSAELSALLNHPLPPAPRAPAPVFAALHEKIEHWLA